MNKNFRIAIATTHIFLANIPFIICAETHYDLKV